MKLSTDARGGFPSRSLLLAGLALGLFATTAPAGNPIQAGQIQRITPVDQADLDTDGDGLSDALEHILGTSSTSVDSDDDGFSDSEELARHSDPTARNSVPASQPMSVGIAVTAHDGTIHAISALYYDDGVLADKTFQLGMMIHGNVVNVDPSRYGYAALDIVPSHDPNAVLAVLEARLPARPLHLVGQLSLFSTVAGPSGIVQSASAINLVSVEGVILERDVSYFLNSSTGAPQTGAGAGGLYRPLGGSIPSTWSQGQVCAQTLSVVGVDGPVVTQEVEDANCEDALDGACSPGGCSASIGTTVRIMDPVALVGG